MTEEKKGDVLGRSRGVRGSFKKFSEVILRYQYILVPVRGDRERPNKVDAHGVEGLFGSGNFNLKARIRPSMTLIHEKGI